VTFVLVRGVGRSSRGAHRNGGSRARALRRPFGRRTQNFELRAYRLSSCVRKCLEQLLLGLGQAIDARGQRLQRPATANMPRRSRRTESRPNPSRAPAEEQTECASAPAPAHAFHATTATIRSRSSQAARPPSRLKAPHLWRTFTVLMEVLYAQACTRSRSMAWKSAAARSLANDSAPKAPRIIQNPGGDPLFAGAMEVGGSVCGTDSAGVEFGADCD
jgi:hypothetical protein